MTGTHVTISGLLSFCDLPCGSEGDYNVDHHKSMVFTYYCRDRFLDIYGGYKERTTLDATCGCVNISDVREDDAGTYFIYFTDKDQSKRLHHTVDCDVLAPIIISNISMTSTGENSSLTVFFTGDEPASVTWSKIGGELPEGYLLSNHDKTLTIPGTATGVYRVVVCNAASEDSHEYSVPEEDRFSRWIIVAAIIPVLIVIVLVIINKKRKRAKDQRKEEEERHNSVC
ncbi:uncharacterized protein [Phyllobates terribilis]